MQKFPFLKSLLLSMLILTHAANAIPELPADMSDGGCWADPMNNLAINIYAPTFKSNTEGSTARANFTTKPGNYEGWCYSTQAGQIPASRYKAEMLVTVAGKTAGYLKLSEDVDFMIHINLNESFYTPPFTDINGNSALGAKGKGITKLETTNMGNSGYIDLRLRRDLMGGALYIPGGIEITNLYRYIFPRYPSTVPMYRLFTERRLLYLPAECRINNGDTIKVPFGNVDRSLLTRDARTSLFRQPRSLQYRCNTALTQDIRINLAADSAGFSDAIKTSNLDIGVVMLHQNQPVKPKEGFKSKVVNGQGSDEITFAVVRSGSTPKTGPFTGSATLIISNL